ncbi:MAG: acetyltransferase [Acidimicrobiia bacterium]|nr:acetyltransferase [Acidimicrobiia bacterium]
MAGVIAVGLLLCPMNPSFAQIAIMGSGPGGSVRLHNTDMAVLEAGDPRSDLPCVVSPTNKAFLGFDLRFHAGYDISVPLKELAGSENLLTILFRVFPKNRSEKQHYFIQRIRVPSIEEEAKGDAVIQGGFDIGEGEYKVDLLIRDRSERVCSFYWDVEAELPNKDKDMALAMTPGMIEPVQYEQFLEEPPVERASGEQLNVKVMVNFAPQKANASTLRPVDTAALVSILRTISREPKFGKFSVVAFNMHEQKVVYRQDSADKIDFPAIGGSLESISLGTVDLKRLSNKRGDTEFLSSLIANELGSSSKPDAVIFAGPKSFVEENVPRTELEKLGEPDYPVFYMNYSLNPYATPWRDAIGHAVKFLKGTEYTISKPRDLWFAFTEMVSRIVKSRNGKQLASVSSK